MYFAEEFTNINLQDYIGVNDDVDKLNFGITPVIIISLSFLCGIKQYILKPISCYISTSVGGENINNYVENLCWVEGMIPLDVRNDTIPTTTESWDKLEHLRISYYHWVPYLLGLQAVMFYLPNLIWLVIVRMSTGYNFNEMIESATNAAQEGDESDRLRRVKYIAYMFDKHVIKQSAAKKRSRCAFSGSNFLSRFISGRQIGLGLWMGYFFTKCLYLFNTVIQTYCMQLFLNVNNEEQWYGAKVIHNFIQGKDWETTNIFPRMAFCRVPFKNLNGVNWQTAQCAIPMNMLNEKIYIFLWFWIMLLNILNLISIPRWYINFLFKKSGLGFIKRHMKCHKEMTVSCEKKQKRFTQMFLQKDGVFMLRIIAKNAGDMIVSDIIMELWKMYSEDLEKKNKDTHSNETNTLI